MSETLRERGFTAVIWLTGFLLVATMAGCAGEPRTADATCARLGPDGQIVYHPCTVIAE